MFRTAVDIAGGVAAVAIAVSLGVVIAGADLPAPKNEQHASVNREAKTDKLPVNEVATQKQKISVIEVIGVSDAAVVYRDRSGQMLFKTDPMSNVTVVAKNSVLPEITVRETEANEVLPVPVELPQKPAAVREIPNDGPASAPKRMTEGCESAFSSFLVPSQSKVARRCVSSIESETKLSSLN
jgi:hypothetical protein